jgi:hypothetical protein
MNVKWTATLCTFMTYRPILLIMTYVSDQHGRVNHNTFHIQQLLSENRAACEIMWKKNILESDWPQMIMRRTRIVHWITKATDTHSAYVILTEFSHQQWLSERASVVPHTHSASLVYNFFPSVSLLMTSDLQNHAGFSAAYRYSMFKWRTPIAFTNAYVRIHSTH